MNWDVDWQAGRLQEVSDQVSLDDHCVDRTNLAVGRRDERGGGGGGLRADFRRRGGGGRGGRDGRVGSARGEDWAEKELEHPPAAPASPPLTGCTSRSATKTHVDLAPAQGKEDSYIFPTVHNPNTTLKAFSQTEIMLV